MRDTSIPPIANDNKLLYLTIIHYITMDFIVTQANVYPSYSFLQCQDTARWKLFSEILFLRFMIEQTMKYSKLLEEQNAFKDEMCQVYQAKSLPKKYSDSWILCERVKGM